MSYLRIKANKCGYKEKDRGFKEQFINDISDDDMMREIIRELATFRKTIEITSREVLALARGARH